MEDWIFNTLDAFSVFDSQMQTCAFCVSPALVLYLAPSGSLFSCYDLAAGVEVSPEEIKAAVSSVIDVNKDLLLEERYRANGEMIFLSVYWCSRGVVSVVWLLA